MHPTSQRGLFLTLEGVDGAGKSTHIPFITRYLERKGITVVVTREPGGTPLGEKLRDMLLYTPMSLKTEALLMFAARNEHIEQVIEPALAAGNWVLCDRFTDASFAYQGGGRQLGAQPIEQLEQWTHPHLQPDHTWLFDLDLRLAQERLRRTRDMDRFETEEEDFFIRTQQFYHLRAQRFPQRFKLIDSSQSIDVIEQQLAQQMDTFI
ncbi:dTMP kinase [Paenalcaligenes hominis]|uniref:Thymidylate kinase n=1 Tax=Paenalcaligenes hominis TaxID=643674 RepID=A0ABX0WQ69_9BURK|nr:dTMP kinase [Paenalcaligenes hominis]NJB64485.1 dTMP kinase [Paenalcaligenes hominis]GGE67286.1 thymidylate kinase [Paenalcaligenes hominis]